jgi:hypothetical protein
MQGGKFKNIDSDDSDNENQKRNLVTYLKLPPVKQMVNDATKHVKVYRKFIRPRLVVITSIQMNLKIL